MSIYGPAEAQAHVEQTYVDAQDGLRVQKIGDIMTGDLHMSGKLVRGLPTVYPPTPPQYTDDCAVSWTQAVKLVQSAITTVPTPTLPLNAANKAYVDAVKPVISLVAEQNGALHGTALEWSFGDGVSSTYIARGGFAMPARGRLLRMSLTVIATTGATTIPTSVRLFVNGIGDSNYTVVKPNLEYTGVAHFTTPRELYEGNTINFQTLSGVSNAGSSVLCALIELDL